MSQVYPISHEVLSLCFFLRQPVPKPTVVIIGEVTQDIDVAGGMAGGNGSQPEYAISLHVKNQGDSPLTLSLAKAEWIPNGGQVLTQNQTFIKEGAGVIAAGEEKEFRYDTDDSTMDLLGSSKDGSLVFQFTLLNNKTVVAGPFHTSLPKMAALPGLVHLQETYCGIGSSSSHS